MSYYNNMRIVLVRSESRLFYVITDKSNSKIKTINKKAIYLQSDYLVNDTQYVSSGIECNVYFNPIDKDITITELSCDNIIKLINKINCKFKNKDFYSNKSLSQVDMLISLLNTFLYS